MKRFVFIAIVTGAIAVSRADACSVCFGDPDTPQGKALNAAVWTLLGATSAVLLGAAAFFVTLYRRAKAAGQDGGGYA